MSMPEFSNPFVYAQFNMRGGWKNTLVVAAAYALLVGGIIVATVESSGTHVATTLAGWATGLLAIQALTLIMYGTTRVSAVVRADVKSGVIESHRLMPVSPYTVVAGYIIGAPIQAIFLAIVTLVIGIFICPGASIDIPRWLVANGMLVAFSIMIWVLTMQLALSTKGGVPVLFISVVIGVFTNSASAVLLPAISVLLCPIVGRSVFSLRDSFGDFSFAYICSLVGQGAVALVCFLAAVRRYRRADEPGFNLPLGLALVAVMIGLSAVGMSYADEFRVSMWHMQMTTELISSAVLGMATSLVPISAAARRRAQWRRDPLALPEEEPRVPTFVAVVLCTLIVSVLFLLGGHGGFQQRQMALSIVETLAALAGLGAVLRWAYLAVNKAWFITSIWIVLFWVLPLVADTIQRSLQDRSADQMGPIASLSPLGVLIILWTGNKPHDADLGVLFASAIVIFPVLLVLTTQRRQQSRRMALMPPPLPI